MDTAKPFEVVRARTAESERTAHHDGAIAARQFELVHRLLVQRNAQSLRIGSSLAPTQHVGRRVTAVDVDPDSPQRQQQAPGPATGVERGLAARLYRAPEVLNVVAVVIELGPPARHQAVVPDA